MSRSFVASVTVLLVILCTCHIGYAIPCNVTPSINIRTDNSDIIIKGRVLRLYQRTHDNYFPADVVVTEVYKGYQLFLNISSIALAAPDAGVTNVYHIEDFFIDNCITEITAHSEYIFFLTTGYSRPVRNAESLPTKTGNDREFISNENAVRRTQLKPQYKSIVDPLVDFTEEGEKEVLKRLGWRPWGTWSACNSDCGTGKQNRRRTCDKDVVDACEGAAKEERECNTFRCEQMRDLRDLMGLQDRPNGVRLPRNRHTAYRITPDASITIDTSMIYTRSFPDEFSILLTVKPRPIDRSLDNSNLYAMVMVDDEQRLELAIHIGRHPAILYGHPDGIRTITFRDYDLSRDWHFLAFGIRRDSVTLIADCSQKFVHPLPVGDEISIDIDGFTSIGDPEGGVVDLEDITFSGDLEQFVILEYPDAANLQCSSQSRMLPIPPPDLFDRYPVPNPNTVDVPFDFDLSLVNTGSIASTESPNVPVPTTVHSTTEEAFESTVPPQSPTKPEIELTEIPDDNFIPPVNIFHGEGDNVIPSRGDHPDIVIYPEQIKIPSTMTPKIERSIIRTTKAPNIIASKITPTKFETSTTIKGQPAVVPTNTNDISPGESAEPPGNQPPDGRNVTDDGNLFEEEEVASGEEVYDDVGVEWSTWSTCTTTCGLGTRYRFGFCQKDSTYLDCLRGHTITAQRRNCKLHSCPGAMQWSAWSACSKTCGKNSIRTRMAFCPDEEAHPECMHPGQAVVERETCDIQECHDVCQEECQNGGACHDGACVCPPGYSGNYCQHQTCNPQCRNGGLCLGNNICSCPEGTFKPYCSRLCTPDCQNGAECISGNRCQCRDGFQGLRCETPICSDGCQNGGRCVAPNKCQCPNGYGGADCSQPQCLLGCLNNGQCIKPDYCRCQTAYRGSRCQIGYCRERCRNGGTCIGADRCKCKGGFTGAFCQKSKCPRGCSPSMTCVGHNRCVPSSFSGGHRSQNGGNNRRKTWCPLSSYSQRVQTSYVKPVIRSIQISCGPFGLQKCNSQRLEYTIAYRTSYKTSYRCAGRG